MSNLENIVFLLDAANEKSYSLNNTHSLGYDAIGQQSYTSPGTYSWTCPANVTSVSVVCVGGGGGGGGRGTHVTNGSSAQGGYGGGLGYVNNFSVTPGQSYTVVVGGGGNAGNNSTSGSSGGSSYFNSSTTVKGQGGPGGLIGSDSSVGSYQSAAGYVGHGGGYGGRGGRGNQTNSSPSNPSGGGGGAGGYSGNGGDGGDATSSTFNSGSAGSGGSGGGGSSGGMSPTFFRIGAGGGGGVGLLGEGSSGGATSTPSGSGTYGGKGGSGGSDAADNPWVSGDGYVGGSNGALYGGGGGGHGLATAARNGAGGAVRIMWGPNRAYPSTNTTDQFTNSGTGSENIWADLSKQKRSAVLAANASFVSNGIASHFDTTSAFCSVSNDTSLNPSYITLSVWVKFDVNSDRALIAKRSGTGAGSYWLYVSSSNEIMFDTYQDSTQNRQTHTYNFSTGTWYNITATYSSSAKVIYVNGSSVNSTSGGNPLTSVNTDLYIGRDSYLSQYAINGKLSNVSIYDKALTAAEVQQNFNLHRGRFGI